MQTPSEPTQQWEARPCGERRSIFRNYQPGGKADAIVRDEASVTSGETLLRRSSDEAMARSFVYQFISRAFSDPREDVWAWMGGGDVRRALWSAVGALHDSSVESAALAFMREFTPGALESFADDFVATFGHAARGSVPMNEIEYGDLKADPLFQPHRLADLAAFYRAFGLELDDAAAERHDHLCIELEFMSVLAAKEAYAIAEQLDGFEVIRQAQRNFLREHLGRWSPAFGRRLRAAAGDGVLAALGNFLRTFVEAECTRLGVRPGSEDLLLRPVDEAAERLCESCGLRDLPPGALAGPADN
jgi:DMSO reductase family type II enzyme chaperone